MDLAAEAREREPVLATLLGGRGSLKVCAPQRPVTARLSPPQLQAVLTHLVTNARDALPEGNGTVEVSVGHDEAAGVATLQVTDDGTGMTPDVLAHATEPFFTTKTANPGTGLGLTIVQATVVAAGGRCWLDSHPSTGTAVHIALPAVATLDGRPTGSA